MISDEEFFEVAAVLMSEWGYLVIGQHEYQHSIRVGQTITRIAQFASPQPLRVIAPARPEEWGMEVERLGEIAAKQGKRWTLPPTYSHPKSGRFFRVMTD